MEGPEPSSQRRMRCARRAACSKGAARERWRVATLAHAVLVRRERSAPRGVWAGRHGRARLESHLDLGGSRRYTFPTALAPAERIRQPKVLGQPPVSASSRHCNATAAWVPAEGAVARVLPMSSFPLVETAAAAHGRPQPRKLPTPCHKMLSRCWRLASKRRERVSQAIKGTRPLGPVPPLHARCRLRASTRRCCS